METLRLVMSATSAVCALLQLGLVVLLLRGPRTFVNFALATYLAMNGASAITGAIQIGTHDGFLWVNAELYSEITSLIAASFYLAFVGAAIASPLSRWLAARPVRLVVLALAPLGIAFMFFGPGPLFEGPRGTFAEFLPDAYSPGPASRMLFDVLLPFAVGSAALATLAALDAWRRAPEGSVARRRARAYFAAFAFNDASIVAGYSWALGVHGDNMAVVVYLVNPILGLVFAALLARALLRDQLFDFDLKLKLNIKRGTVVAIFAAVFVIVAQVASNYLQGAFGWLAGGVAAGAMLLLLRPIERAADRVAERAMPRVQGTPAYVAFRKMEVYKAAVEEVVADGVVSQKDRRVLDRLRAQLDLSAEDAIAMERDVAPAVAMRGKVA